MNWIRGLAVLSAVGMLGLLVMGFLLPKEYVATRTLTVDQSPAAVWAVLDDYPGQADWRPELEAVTPQPKQNGNPVWQEVYKSDDKVTFEILEATPPTKLVKRTVSKDEDAPVGVWTFEIAPTDAGSTVTITEEGSIPGPLFRLMVHFLIGPDAFVNGFAESLDRKLSGTEPTDVPAEGQPAGEAA